MSKRRKSKYPRVIFTDGFTRVVQTKRDGFTWERRGSDALSVDRWNEAKADEWPGAERRMSMLLGALSACADRKRRRQRRRTK